MATPSADTSLSIGEENVSRPAQEAMTSLPHISVCICTYKRPVFLRRLLAGLGVQETNNLFTYSIVVADNDQLRSAEPVVANFAKSVPISIKYCIEPHQNIALTRNKAIENADGSFIAFIDDDEFPCECWLLNIFQACTRHQVDGVLGPVLRHFDETPPRWLVKSNFYVRPRHETGFVMGWMECRTGNLLLDRRVFGAGETPFRPEFRTGEDRDFFHRKIDQGRTFIWCNDAPVYETVPPSRWKCGFMLRRALLRGATAVLHPTFGPWNIAKSITAVLLYSVALPFSFLIGYHHFMSLLVRLFDHLGALLALMGLNPVKSEYVTE
jgi:succinoglycan biosynthesis protein ExoM